MVLPVSIISSSIITSLPNRSTSSPIDVITDPDDFVPLYDASLIKQISAGIFSTLKRSDANIKEPFRIVINTGVFPE